MKNDVTQLLDQSEKGRLEYGAPRKQSSLFIKENQLFVPLEREVFDLRDMRAALEICDESALADERRHNEKKQVGEYLEHSRRSLANTNERTQVVDSVNLDKDMQQMEIYYCEKDKKLNEANIKSKTKLYEDMSSRLAKSAMSKYSQLQHRHILKFAQLKQQIQQYESASKETAKQIVKQNFEQHQSRTRMRMTRMEEAENRRKMKQQQAKERLQRAEPLFIKVKKSHQIFVSETNDSRNAIFSNNPSLILIEEELERSILSASIFIRKCSEQGGMEQAEYNKLIELCGSLENLTNEFLIFLERLRSEEAEKEQVRQEALKIAEAEAEKALKIEQAEKERELANQNPENACPSLPKELSLSVSRSAYHSYMELKTVLKEYEERKQRFVSNKSNLKLVMAINKAISVPVSSLTSRSGSDIKNKIKDLVSVLKGENIKVNNQLASLNEDALSYASLCMAQKFVKQAEGQVSANHSAAFCLALAVFGVWSKHVAFGQLFLAQLQSRCPFVVPWYVPQLPGESEVEYNKKRGYLYNDDGTVEKQDKYLGRMSGLVRTYAALIQSPLPPGVRDHPHGTGEAWKWLARMLNLDPWPDVTATVLFDFVEVCGHAMKSSYDKQFEKLLYALCHDYFPKIEEVSEGGGGPLQRLQMFLKECLKLKSVPKPDGYLSDQFWNTYHHTGVVGS